MVSIRNESMLQKYLLHFSEQLLATLDPQKVLNLGLRHLAQLLPADNLVISLFKPDEDCMEFTTGLGNIQSLIGYRYPLSGSGSGYAAQMRQPVIIPDLDQEKRFFMPNLKSLGTVSAVITPMLSGEGRVPGTVIAAWNRKYIPGKRKLRILSLIANQTAIAWERAQLHAQTRSTLQNEQTLLFRLSKSLLPQQDIIEAAGRALGIIVDHFSLDRGAVAMLDHTGSRFTVLAVHGWDAETIGRTACNKSCPVLQKKPVIWFPNNSPCAQCPNPLLDLHKVASGVTVPIITGDRVTGMLAVHNNNVRRFSDEEIRLLSLAANHTSIALERARLHGETQDHLFRQQQLNKVASRIAQQRNLDELLPEVVVLAQSLVRTDSGLIAILDEQTGRLSCPYLSSSYPKTLSEVEFNADTGVTGRTITEGKPVVIEDYPSFPQAIPDFIEAGVKSVLSVPLKIGERTIGALALTNFKPRKFTGIDVELAVNVADQAAVAIENARLVSALSRSENIYRTLVENAPFGVYKPLFEHNIVFPLNNEARTLFGSDKALKPQTVTGRGEIKPFLDPSSYGDMEPVQRKINLVRADGSIRTVLDHRIPVIHNDQLVEYIGFALDITDHQLIEEDYREFVKNLPDIVFRLDEQGRIAFANPAGSKMLGYPLNEVIGRHFLHVVDETYLPAARKIWQNLFTGREEIVRTELKLKHKNGIALDFEVFARARYGPGQDFLGIEGVARDITERKKAEEQQRRQHEELKTLHRKLRDLSIRDKLTGLYNRLYFDETLQNLEAAPHSRPISIIMADLDNLKIINDSLGHAKGDELLQAAARVLRKPFRKNDIIARIGGDEFAVVLPRASTAVAEGKCEEILEAVKAHNAEHPDLHISLSVGCSSTASGLSSIQDVLKEADAAMYRHKMARKPEMRQSIVKSLQVALNERDHLTGAHGERLVLAATIFGQAVGLSANDLEHLELLTLLHDIGKIAVPGDILFKAGPLTESERKEMQRHCEAGYHIALASPELAPIADLILHHHERWDGSGYPAGLAGEDIPLACRVLAILDAYDAMINDRPYRKAMPSSQAVAELHRSAGTQFDPDLVTIFTSQVLPQVEAMLSRKE
ncbi:MAG: GAF domain-containing protein [Peptococcaceae bacterium]|nr:GAF domain-containing protein [Peptococcaceae bacterium]